MSHLLLCVLTEVCPGTVLPSACLYPVITPRGTSLKACANTVAKAVLSSTSGERLYLSQAVGCVQ